MVKTKVLISFGENKGADQLRSFVFANADCWFSHAAAHICSGQLKTSKMSREQKKIWHLVLELNLNMN